MNKVFGLILDPVTSRCTNSGFSYGAASYPLTTYDNLITKSESFFFRALDFSGSARPFGLIRGTDRSVAPEICMIALAVLA